MRARSFRSARAKGAKLRPMFHMCGFLGCGVPIFEIRETGGKTDMLIRTAALGKALAESLGDKNVVLMRGHGATMVGEFDPGGGVPRGLCDGERGDPDAGASAWPTTARSSS